MFLCLICLIDVYAFDIPQYTTQLCYQSALLYINYLELYFSYAGSFLPDINYSKETTIPCCFVHHGNTSY